ncbi:MAG: hypothetical protein IJ713_07525 [Oscillibacter sp.]|nr:hypothetical protein [Oscillibacter sp.]
MNCKPQVFAFPASCSPKMGGLQAIYVADPTAVNVTVNEATGRATLAAVTSGAKPFYTWELAPNASTLESTAQVNAANNTRFWQHVLTAVLNNFSPETAGADVLTRLTRLCIVVETRGGDQLLVSAEKVISGAVSRGAEVTGFVINEGTQRSDAAGRATITATLDSFLTPLATSVSNLVNA